MFIIEDEIHCEVQEGEYGSFEDAVGELKRRSLIPWNEEPNKCPCTSWKTCERNYLIIELDVSENEIKRIPILNISATQIKWFIK